MQERLLERYPLIKRSLVLSNAVFADQLVVAPREKESKCRIVGHLSVLSIEKGLFDVVDLARWAKQEKLDLEFRVAGPFATDEVKRQFEARSLGLENLRYIGPVYGEAKKKFFDEIDVFVFPTRYRNEAEPLVVIEALSQRCPVISYERGCIGSMLDSSCGVIVPKGADFLSVASAVLIRWQSNNEEFAKLCDGARGMFERMVNASSLARAQLASILVEKTQTDRCTSNNP